MKKITFIMAMFLIASFTYAQQANTFPAEKVVKNLNKENVKFYQNSPTSQTKAPGDVIYSYDFNAALPAGWTTTDNTGNSYVWIWSDIGPIGAYTGNPNWDDPIDAIASTTSANGFMLFQADNYNTDQGTGVIVGTVVDQDSYIQTDAIDLSAESSVILTYQQRFRCCCIWDATDDLFVEVSNDGTTWTAFEVGSPFGFINDHVPGSYLDVTQVEINISNIAGGESTVYVRFHMLGVSHYYWMIDDVEFVEGYADDIVLEKDYADVFSLENGWYGQIPLTQSRYMPMAFRAAVYNNGNTAAANVGLNVDVTHFGAPYYSENSAAEYPVVSLASLARDTITLGVDIPGSAWLPTAFNADEFGTYEFSYSIFMDAVDNIPANDSASRTFEVTDTVYARDGGILTGRVSPSDWSGWGTDGDMFASSFDINNDTAGACTGATTPGEIKSLRFYVHSQTTFTGTPPTIRGAISMYDGGAGTFSEILTTDYYDIQPTDSSQWVTLDLQTDGFSEYLAEGFYLAVLEITAYNGGDFYVGEDGASPQSSMATFWKQPSDADFARFGNYEKSMMLHAIFQPCITVDVATISKLENVKMFPNPTTGILNIANADNATVYIYNIMGDIVKTVEQNINKIDISDLSNGNYIVKVVADQGISTQKITLVK